MLFRDFFVILHHKSNRRMMMKKELVMSLTVLLAGVFVAVSAQGQVNMKFGKPTKEELQMTVYEPEPEAEAVVLCRLTDVE